jgi:hypothetical protein
MAQPNDGRFNTLHRICHRRGGSVLMISLATREVVHDMVVVYAALEDFQCWLSEVCFGSSHATVNHSRLRQICIRDLTNIQYL